MVKKQEEGISENYYTKCMTIEDATSILSPPPYITENSLMRGPELSVARRSESCE